MKELPNRLSRGKRMNDLIGEEIEYDGLFWGQDIFKETLSDEEYKTESEKEDKFDEDFFKEESEEDTNPQEPKLEKQEKCEKVFSVKLAKKKKKKLKIEKQPGITQKEMLEQAAITEMYNTHDLNKYLNLEEKSKTNLVSKKEKLISTWKYVDSAISGKRKTTIWHTEPLHDFSSKKPVKKYCAITGKIAKYTDPLTGLHYVNKEAFKKIRDNYYIQQELKLQAHIRDLEAQLQNYNNK